MVKTLPFHGSNMGSNPVRVIFCHIYINIIAGWSSLVARRAHNPKVVGSNPAPAIMVLWSSWLGRLPVTQEITGSSPVGTVCGSVAQSVEQCIEAACVGSSILSRAIFIIILMRV